MGFLERFFSPDSALFVIASANLLYLLKIERRLARVETFIDIFLKHAAAPAEEEG